MTLAFQVSKDLKVLKVTLEQQVHEVQQVREVQPEHKVFKV